MKVLITGGFGYLGGRIGQFFAQNNYEVLLGTRAKASVPDWLPQAKPIHMDWHSQDRLYDVCNNVDIVIHAAGMNAHDCAINPAAALECNGVFTARILEAAIRQGVQRFIYLSTAHVYRSPLVGTITEDSDLLNQHPYATSHRVGEAYVLRAFNQGRIEGVVARMSNIFGSPTHVAAPCWMLLFNDLSRQALLRRQITLISSGTLRRDFLTITDACSALFHLSRVSPKEIGVGIFNIGGNWSPTLIEVAHLIQDRCEKGLGFRPELICSSPPVDSCEDHHLEYRTVALARTGYRPQGRRIEEIDNLLYFCKVNQKRL